MKLLMIIFLPILLWLFVASCKEVRKRYCEDESEALKFYSDISWIVGVGGGFIVGVLYLLDKSVCLCAAS